MKERVLIVDDDPTQGDLLRMLVAQLDCVAECHTSAESALDALARAPFDAVLTDLEMDPIDGVELCGRVAATRPDLPVILVTAVGSMASAVAAMRAGAYDFLAKPVELNALGLALRRAFEHRRLREEVKLLREAPAEGAAAGGMVGDSEAIRRVRDLIGRVGPSDASVLIQGETGTGKELVARAVHAASPRRDRRFLAINCAAVPAGLLESELFGHARGAFTDAKAARDGLFVTASGGTLFLDEIGEMPIEMQAKLLRALQERVVRPVGGEADVPFDVRLVAATHRDLDRDIAEGRFREDLYYRVNVVKVPVPPLRDRGNDVLALAGHFLRTACSRAGRDLLELTPGVASLLLSYEWPGNVRELENCIERAVALARFSHLSAEDLPEKIQRQGPRSRGSAEMEAASPEEVLPLEEVERRYILRALRVLHGNRSRAAALLRLDRRTLYRRLEKYGVTSGDEPSQSAPAART